MIIEIQDIIQKEQAFGHVALCPGLTLGQIFDKDEKLRAFQDHIVQATFNGQTVNDWKSLSPGKNDKVKLLYLPKAFVAAGLFAVGAFIISNIGLILTVISIARFLVSLFNPPKSPKSEQGPRESATYGFQGIQNTFIPGNVIPVTYGVHRVGGQMLMWAVDVSANRKGQDMSLLISLGHGDVSCVTCVKINNVFATEVPSLTITTRLGTSSQEPIDGFTRIRNTFFDGRDVSTRSIIYTTFGKTVEGVDLQLVAPQGIFEIIGKGKHPNRKTWMSIDYTVEKRPTGDGDFTMVATRRFQAFSIQPMFDNFGLSFPSIGQWDVRLTWVGAKKDRDSTLDHNKLNLKNVTEYEELSQRLSSFAFSGTVLLGIRAAATEFLHGGRPNITALMFGRPVRVYDTVESFSTVWTQNPAWPLLDYMTNSVYGVGKYISVDDVDIQSFIDFATLCDSTVSVCSG